MNIAIDARFIIPGRIEGYGTFTYEIFKILIRTHPSDQFYFLFDRETIHLFDGFDNVHQVTITPAARHPLLWKYWYDYKVPAVLKRIKADVFVCPNGFCSFRTKVPQLLVIHDLGFLHYADFYKKSHAVYYKKNTPAFIKKAALVVTVSQFSAEDLKKEYPFINDKIKIVYNGVKDIFGPISKNRQQEIKNQYSGGKEYFLYTGAIHPRKNLVNLLKAFSIFKKRLKSGMKLILVGRLAWKNNEFTELLRTYKFREDVIVTGYVSDEELVDLLGAAYAFVYPSLWEGFGIPVAESMKMQVPVLTTQDSAMSEVAFDAALYFDPDNPSDIADKLMKIYKDEGERNVLIEKGIKKLDSYSWQSSAEEIWNSIKNIIQ